MKITIIGASGKLGSKLSKYLFKEGNEITGIVRSAAKGMAVEAYTKKVYQVSDITNTAELAKALKNAEYVINTGYIWFAKHICEALKENNAPVKHIIFTGSTGIYTKLDSPSAELKRTAEKYIRKNISFPYTILRPTMIYGHPNDGNISKLVKAMSKTNIFPLIGSGNKFIQPIHINDLLCAYQRVLGVSDYYGQSFDLGGPVPISNKHLFEKTSKLLKKKILLIKINKKLAYNILKFIIKFRHVGISLEQILRFGENKN
ncbi:NAD(P)H-binding protein, partial [bacterium]|nr:NAD(P)H-binding protein [bacterium]